jgi:hypothetical protein
MPDVKKGREVLNRHVPQENMGKILATRKLNSM